MKETIVLSVLRGELGMTEAARQHGVNESLIHILQTQFLDAGRARVLGRSVRLDAEWPDPTLRSP